MKKYKGLVPFSQFGTTMKDHLVSELPVKFTEASAASVVWGSVSRDQARETFHTQASHYESVSREPNLIQ